MRKGNIIYGLISAAIFIILEVAALTMLSHNAQLQRTWISSGIQGVMGSVWGFTQNISDYFSLRKSNDELAQENFELRLKLAKAEEALTADLKAEIPAGSSVGEYIYIPATIVKISNNTQHNYMIVGKGSNQGVVEGAGVITGKGAVGVIDAVSENYSYARSFKNHEMSISARLGKEGAVGPLSWNGRTGNGAILKEIPHHVEFAPGDTVYTSGYSSIFPPDIPLGVTGASKIVNGATYEIEVKLFEDFGAVRYVTVVENKGQVEMKRLEEEQ